MPDVRVLLLWVLAVPMWAAQLTLSTAHAAVRPGLLHRVDLSLAGGSGSGDLVVRLTGDRDLLCERRFPAVAAARLASGFTVNWVVPERWPPQPLRVEALWLQEGVTVRQVLPVADLLTLAQRLSAVATGLPADGDALPALWIEQAAAELTGPTDLKGVALALEAVQRCEAWLAGRRPDPGVERALRDAVDGSVQPWRLHRPSGQARGLALCLREAATGSSKGRWPPMSAGLREALAAAGWAVAEVHPAGDAAWDGVAVTRVAQVYAAARRELGDLPVLVVADGPAAGGALRFAARSPAGLRALVLERPRWAQTAAPAEPADADAARWRELRNDPTARLGQLQAVPMVVAGRPDAAMSRLLDRLRAVGGRLRLVDGLEPDLWRDLPPPPQLATRAFRVLEPGRYGPVTVAGLDDWARGGVLEVAGDDLTTAGLRGVRWADGPLPPGLRIDGRAYVDPPPLADAKALGRAFGPLAAYARGPFVVVLGAGEHAADARALAHLARRFTADWGRHALGRPALVSAADFRPEDWAGHHLVLLGGPRSNLVTARLLAAAPGPWPVQWDHRSISVAGRSLLRAGGAGVALARPHPADPRRLLVVLDGAPVWPADGLPLAGLGDCAWVSAESPARFLVFDSDWR